MKEMSKARVKIELDSGEEFVLYKGEVRTYGIRENQEIDWNAYHTITEEVLPKRAKLRAMNLLKARSYTTAQLREKLELGGYSGQIVQEAIDYVTSFGYLDDERYALDFIEYNKETKSQKRIFVDLLKKGISEAVCESAWEEVVGHDNQELEQKQILGWIAKKKFQPETSTLEEKQKMMAFLYRKGFSIDSIKKSIF
jgi:regulatory protein